MSKKTPPSPVIQIKRIATEKLKVSADKLTIGMYVCELDRPWLESPFLVQGFVLKDQQDIEKVQQVCQFVYIDAMREHVNVDVSGKSYTRTRYVEKVSFASEISHATTSHEHAKAVLDDIYQTVRLSASFDSSAAKAVVKECTNSIIDNERAMLWLTLIKNRDAYTAEHSLNVCVLAIALGKKTGLLPLELENVGISGLLHDLGKARVPLEVLNKEGALTEKEFDLMKSHPGHGRRLLLGKPGVYSGAVDVAFGHHERLNGNGYPRGVNGKKINYFTRIVTIVDAYDAITSDRVYSKGKSSFDALKILKEASGTHFDPNLVKHFIQLIGIYPAGSIAELSSGEVGIVLPVAEQYKMKPKILIVRDSDKNSCKERILNLTKQSTLADCTEYKITRLLVDGSHGVKIKDYYQNGLILGEQ